MPNPALNRDVLASFLPNHQAVRAFEKTLEDVTASLPATIEDANNNAGSATAAAQQALFALAEIAGALAQLLMAPAVQPAVEPDDLQPRMQIGTIASQNADDVDIAGGAIAGIDTLIVGGSTLNVSPPAGLEYVGSAGRFFIRTNGQEVYLAGAAVGYMGTLDAASVFNLLAGGNTVIALSSAGAVVTGDVSTDGQLKSTVAIGTPPLVVTSTTKVNNLYAARAFLSDTATVATSAGTADSLTNPTTFPADATDLPTVITLANALKAAAVAKGL